MKSNIIQSEASQNLIAQAISKLAQIVGVTLGPHGKTVALQTQQYFEPRLTKDGITVAKSIRFQGEQQLVSDLVNKALQRVDEIAGDGTTSALILMNSLYQLALKEANNGSISLPDLKLQLQVACDKAIALLKEQTIIPSKDQFQRLAVTATNDKQLGKLIFDAMQVSQFISVQESINADTDHIEQINGVSYDSGYISPYFCKNSNFVKLQHPIVLISDGVISKIEQIKPWLEESFTKKRPLLVVAADVQGEALNTLLLNNLKGTVDCCAVRGFGYGSQRKANIADLALILKAEQQQLEQAVSDGDNEPLQTFITKQGCQEVIIDSKSCLFATGSITTEQRVSLSKTIGILKERLNSKGLSNYEKEVLNQRIARLQQKTVKIILAGQNAGEKRDRVIDGLMTLKNAQLTGVVKGSGNTHCKIASQLMLEQHIGAQLLGKALQQITHRLSKNYNLSGKYVVQRLSEGNQYFNGLTGQFSNQLDVYDSFESVRQQIIQTQQVVEQLIGVGGIVSEQSDVKDSQQKLVY